MNKKNARKSCIIFYTKKLTFIFLASRYVINFVLFIFRFSLLPIPPKLMYTRRFSRRKKNIFVVRWKCLFNFFFFGFTFFGIVFFFRGKMDVHKEEMEQNENAKCVK